MRDLYTHWTHRMWKADYQRRLFHAEHMMDDTEGPVLLYSDPPWKYNSRSMNRITKFGGGAMAHYPVMTKRELCNLQPIVYDLAGKDCVLHMWVTGSHMIPTAEAVMAAWGFKYSTVSFVWNKLNPKALTPVTTPGYHTSSSCEFVVCGTNSKTPFINKPAVWPVQQYVETPRREHSRKPDEVRNALEKMYPYHRWVEMFAREKTTGWNLWGNEVNKFK